MSHDVIIIGAGLGGLTAGAKLAKEGLRVLLLEQHDRPGGCATTFRRKDFTMEVGLHEMDGLHPRDIKHRIFEDIGLGDRVNFLPVPEFYRFINDRYDLVIPHDPEKAKSILKESFPGEEKGIDAYFYHVLNVRRVMVAHKGKPDRSLGLFLDEIIGDEDLKLVLLGNLGYFHDDPYSLSWLYYLNAQGSYYGGTASFIQGGSQSLSNALSNLITERGGEVRLNQLVTSIDYRGDRVSGVTFQEVKGKNKGQVDQAGAREIIMNGSVPGLCRLLSEKDAAPLVRSIRDLAIGASLLTVYYGFNKPLQTIGNKNYSTFIYDASVRSQRDILGNNHSDFSTRSFTFVDYSQVDARLAPEGKSVGAVCAIDYPSDWEGLERDEYMRMKADVADIFTGRLEKILPGFREAVEYVEVATSLSVERFTLNPKGAVYGFAQHPGRSLDYLSVLPENVFVASAWGKIGGGFSGAMVNGYMTAMEVLRKRPGI
ncbi:MAG: NAD(P)/FAD-dependent oxidoreductase [Bacteroidales bacterium]|nr:NAD(P)/FAD-dependent oxidoreductase [Bacteroidales bacterium]